MALQHLRSGTANKRPIPTAMSDGQLAVNTNLASPGLFFKDSNGDLVKAGPVHVGTTAPNTSPASTAATALVANTVYQILTIGTSDFTAVGASANTVGVVFTATGTTTGTGTVSGQQGVERGEQWLDTTNSLYVMKVYDGTGWRVTDSISLANGSAAAPSLHFGSDTNTGLFRSAADSLAITTAGTQRVVVDASGNVGIGRTDPEQLLHLSSTNTYIALSDSADSGAAGIAFRRTDNDQNRGLIQYDFSNDFMSFRTSTNGTGESLRIDGAGNVGVGETSPDLKFHVKETINVGYSTDNVADDANNLFKLENPSTTANAFAGMAFRTGGGADMYFGAIQQSVNAGDFYFANQNSPNKELMRIKSSGSVKIGAGSTVTPDGNADDLVIDKGAADTGLSILSTTTGRIYFGDAADDEAGSIRYVHSDNTMRFETASSEAMRIDSDGRLLVGTTSAISGSAANDNLQLVNSAGSILSVASSDTTIASGTRIGEVQFWGQPGSTWGNFATIGCFGDASAASNDNPGRLTFSTTADGAASPTQRMQIDSSGRLLVGTTSSIETNSVVQAVSASNSTVILGNTNISSSGEVVINFAPSNSITGGQIKCIAEEDFSTGANRSAFLEFNTRKDGNFINAMRLDSSANLFVGRTSSGQTGNGHSIRGADSAIFSRDSAGETMIVCRNNSEGDLIQFRRNNTICGEIRNNSATSVAYQTSSDYRLKENIVDILDGIARIKQLAPRRFNFIAAKAVTVDGFIAHEAQAVVPEAVSGTKDEVDADGDAVMQGIDQSKLVPLLTAALQEAIAKIETLEQRLSDAGIA